MSQENNKRIAKNTLLLYFRMLFMMAVSLFTSRVILNTLGVEDYGINNVVGGVVAMFSYYQDQCHPPLADLSLSSWEKVIKTDLRQYSLQA